MNELRAVSEPAAAAAPVALSERFTSIDLVRGFALLGILVMNIVAFGLPDAALFNPTIAGGFTGRNYVAWYVSYFIFEHKMMTTFSMLFGAGLVLLTDRAEARGASPARLFYRRAGVLLIFGLLHAYLLWDGEILYSCALCGMATYLVRKWRPWALFVLGVLVLLPPMLFMPLSAAFFRQARAAAERVDAAAATGTPASSADKGLADAWSGIRRQFHPTPAQVSQEIRDHAEGPYLSIARQRAPGVLMMQTLIFAFYVGWDALGRMLIGMGFLKLGVFSADRSRRFYLAMMLLSYGLGLPLVAAGAHKSIGRDFDVVYLFGGRLAYNDIGSILVALGHISAVILVYKAGAAVWVTRRLAAVGRMALSNYLMHTLICTTLFYGYGFGLYGKLDRAQLLGVVVAIWALQLWLSPNWLKSFRFGPAEWLWRSLTYGKAQPMRVAVAA
jgi:uncharacterized protein